MEMILEKNINSNFDVLILAVPHSSLNKEVAKIISKRKNITLNP